MVFEERHHSLWAILISEPGHLVSLGHQPLLIGVSLESTVSMIERLILDLDYFIALPDNDLRRRVMYLIDQCLHFPVDAAGRIIYSRIVLVLILLAMDDLLILLRMLVGIRVAFLLAFLEAVIVVPDTVALHIAALRAD